MKVAVKKTVRAGRVGLICTAVIITAAAAVLTAIGIWANRPRGIRIDLTDKD